MPRLSVTGGLVAELMFCASPSHRWVGDGVGAGSREGGVPNGRGQLATDDEKEKEEEEEEEEASLDTAGRPDVRRVEKRSDGSVAASVV